MVRTVTQAMEQCGYNNTIRFQGKTAAQRIAEDIFQDDFYMCIDKTTQDLQSDLKAFASLPAAHGRIVTTPGIRLKVTALIQWVKSKINTGEPPEDVPFPVFDTEDLVRDAKSHQAYIDKSKIMSETAKPTKFKETMKWEDWSLTFKNFLRDNLAGLPHNPAVVFLENYINRAPLV